MAPRKAMNAKTRNAGLPIAAYNAPAIRGAIAEDRDIIASSIPFISPCLFFGVLFVSKDLNDGSASEIPRFRK